MLIIINVISYTENIELLKKNKLITIYANNSCNEAIYRILLRSSIYILYIHRT